MRRDGVARTHQLDQLLDVAGAESGALELPVAGGTAFEVKDRFANFVNVPELLTTSTPTATSRPPRT